MDFEGAQGSRPLRACGLKPFGQGYKDMGPAVTPFAGVWIETEEERATSAGHYGHALCGRVD